MLTQDLVPEIVQEIDCETERYLTDILAQEKMSAGELIRSLIRDRWEALNSSCASGSTAPASAMQPAICVRRQNSKQMIAEFMHRKCRSPQRLI